MHANGHGAQNLRVRTLAEPDWGCDAISGHQRHSGRAPMNPAHNQLPFMQSDHATACAGEPPWSHDEWATLRVVMEMAGE